MAFQYFQRMYRKDGDRCFSRPQCKRTRSKGFKLKEGGLSLDMQKIFILRVVPRMVVDASSLETFKVRLV